MKLTIILSILCYSTFLNAQVGINTDNPQKMLDINGDLRVTKLETVNEQLNNFDNLLVVDTNNAGVEKVSLGSIILNGEKNIEILRNIYINNTVDENKQVICGDITLKMAMDISDRNKIKPYIKLNSTKIFKDFSNSSRINLIYGTKYFFKEGNSYKYNFTNNEVEFLQTEVADNNLLNDFKKFTNFALYNDEIIIITLSLPRQNNFYRVTFSRLQNSDNGYINSIVCEKFNTKSL